LGERRCRCLQQQQHKNAFRGLKGAADQSSVRPEMQAAMLDARPTYLRKPH
jgi:hypothetical protein